MQDCSTKLVAQYVKVSYILKLPVYIFFNQLNSNKNFENP